MSGPVCLDYPEAAEVIPVVSTEQMLAACREAFPDCDGLIGAAAPCDYRPMKVQSGKIEKTGDPLVLNLIETSDVIATLAADKQGRWVVGFALETEDQRFRALVKLEKKSCDLIVLNGPSAMDSAENQVEVIDRRGSVVGAFAGPKTDVAVAIINVIHERLIDR